METFNLILDQGRPNFHVGIAIKLVAITKEPCLAFSVNHLILGTMQFVSTVTQFFSVLERSSCPWECSNCGLPNFSATLFDSVILDSDIAMASSH